MRDPTNCATAMGRAQQSDTCCRPPPTGGYVNHIALETSTHQQCFTPRNNNASRQECRWSVGVSRGSESSKPQISASFETRRYRRCPAMLRKYTFWLCWNSQQV